MLVVGFAAGFKLHGLLGGIFGLIIAAIFGAVFLGGLLVLNDIRKRVTALEKRG
jgi:hypothetical protein|tara:strand:- start:338 stop:499 length:162 start_codon:yes stop_codon:yes gene_type:complete